MAYENHVNLGTELEDPEGLLEATGKLIRHIRIDQPAMLRKRGVQKLIRQAVSQGIVMAEMKDGIVPRRVTSPASRAKAKSAPKKAKKKKAPRKK